MPISLLCSTPGKWTQSKFKDWIAISRIGIILEILCHALDCDNRHCDKNSEKMRKSACHRTYLQLPWKPLIEVEGSTLYNINANSKVRLQTSLVFFCWSFPVEKLAFTLKTLNVVPTICCIYSNTIGHKETIFVRKWNVWWDMLMVLRRSFRIIEGLHSMLNEKQCPKGNVLHLTAC
jgi:hypothetical protein